jgi:uncharacterized protein YutE (UPF0331/DUF86 family)
VVDRALLAKKVASIRDAVARIRSVLPSTAQEFSEDRTVREIVILNLFVALQDCLALAVHWLADEGWDVPPAYRDVFLALGEHGVLPKALAERLASASGVRNLVAHQYGVLDWSRIHGIASSELDDLLSFCQELARRAGTNPQP